ncbi:hypothetical protein TUM3792_12940 [Shewanella sp. MBTL60-007]|nr:hypothetical protein TUM3792_12940 [Shewanella sp. MBTL60-007]
MRKEYSTGGDDTALMMALFPNDAFNKIDSQIAYQAISNLELDPLSLNQSQSSNLSSIS